jgi:hypothetical protein
MIITHIITLFMTSSKFTLLATEPSIIRWAIDEIQQRPGGAVFSYGVYSLEATDTNTEFGMRMLSGLVNKGWTAFAAENGTYHLKKRFETSN